MKGIINTNWEPLVEIKLIIAGKPKDFKAIIDTGFNGFISIPHKTIKQTAWQFIGYEAYELASGEIIKDKVYLGDILFGGRKKYTYILSNKTSDILIGTNFFAGKLLAINFKTKKLTVSDA